MSQIASLLVKLMLAYVKANHWFLCQDHYLNILLQGNIVLWLIIILYSELCRGEDSLCAIFLCFLLFFPGNILDGEHPTQPWLDGSHQPMKMDSVNLEDGIPVFDTMESSYPWLESIPCEILAINISATKTLPFTSINQIAKKVGP